MANILEQLQNILDYNVIGKFNTKEFAKHNFIPAFIKDSDVMIVTVANSDHSAITSVVASALNISSARYSVVEPDVFKSLLEIVEKNTLSSSSDDDDFDDIGDVESLENFDDIDDFDGDLDSDDIGLVSKPSPAKTQSTAKSFQPQTPTLPQTPAAEPKNSEVKQYSEKAARFAASLNNSISKIQKPEPEEEISLDLGDSKPTEIRLSDDSAPAVAPEPASVPSEPATESVEVEQPVQKTPVGVDLSNIDVKELSKKKIGEILVELGYVNQDN